MKRRRNTGPARTTRELVLERDGGCVMCGAGPYGLQVHHRKPRRMGGRKTPETNAPSNLISLCVADHAWVESRRAEALDMGLLVRETDWPPHVPLHHQAFGLIYLDDEGGWLPAGEPGTDRLLADLKNTASAADAPAAETGDPNTRERN